MTKLTKPVSRLVEIDGKEWVVTLDRQTVTFREKRGRTSFPLLLSAILFRAMAAAADAQVAKRKGGSK